MRPQKNRWKIFKRMLRDSFSDENIRIIDNGRNNKYWKVDIERIKDGIPREIVIKVRRKVMADSGVNYRDRFLEAIEEAKHILSSSDSRGQFLGTILVDIDTVYYHDGKKLDDDWW